MLSCLRASIVVLALMTLLTGVVYPCLVTVVAQSVFPYQANGSIVVVKGTDRGSELIGQPFSQPGHFWGRLSATAPTPYNAAASAGSNYGPLHPELKSRTAARIAALRGAQVSGEPSAVDLVTASGSGLDPHISPAAALAQVPRVAGARKMPPDQVRRLVRDHIEPRQFGLLGEPRVNVLRLNLDLDRILPDPTQRERE